MPEFSKAFLDKNIMSEISFALLESVQRCDTAKDKVILNSARNTTHKGITFTLTFKHYKLVHTTLLISGFPRYPAYFQLGMSTAQLPAVVLLTKAHDL